MLAETATLRNPPPADLAFRALVPAAVLLLLGFALLVNGLGDLRMSGDSSYSVMVARQDLLSITSGRTVDSHPPLFYYLMHFWIRVAGQSELATRFFSAAPSAAALALVYCLGASLFRDRRIALVALVLTATSAPVIYQSRVIRMYGIFILLTLLAIYALLMAVRRGGRRYWLGYLLASSLALYTHYYSLLFLLAAGAYYLLRWRNDFGRARPLLAANACAALLYLPWLAFAGYTASRATAGIISAAPSPDGIVGYLTQTVWLAANIGTVVDLKQAVPLGLFILFATVALVAVGAWPGANGQINDERKKDVEGAMALAAILAITVVVAGLIFQVIPYAVRPRFLLPAVPLYLLLVAWLIVRAAKRRLAIALACAAALLVARVVALQLTYPTEGQIFEPDAVALTEQLQDLARPGDALIFHAGWQIGYFSSHFAAPLPSLYDMAQVPADRAGDVLRGHNRVWLARYSFAGDGPDSLPGWLDKNLVKADDRQVGALRVSLHTRPPAEVSNYNSDVIFASPASLPLARLTAVQVSPGTVQPGGAVVVATQWQALAKLDRRYTVFVHLLDSNDTRVAGRDGEPGGGSVPTTTWKMGQTIEDVRAFLIPPTLPPGDYRLRVGLYASDDPQAKPLSIQDGANGVVGRIVIGSRQGAPPGRAREVGARFGPSLDLVAAELDRDRFDPATIQARTISTADGPLTLSSRPTSYHAGDMLRLTLYWRPLKSQDGDYAVFIRLVGPDGKQYAELESRLKQDLLAVKESPGTLVVGEHELRLPQTLPPGRYQIRLGLRAPATDKPLVPGGPNPGVDTFPVRTIEVAG